MKIGRNDPCPCGSGKKYKQCCLSRINRSEYDLIREAVREKKSKVEIADLLCNIYQYMKEKQWMGACHATCSILYVALMELGENPELCIGEVQNDSFCFDHSWIVLSGEIIDVAAAITLQGGRPVSGPVIYGKDIWTNRSSDLDYGIYRSGLDAEAQGVQQVPFNEYMDEYPGEPDGLWSILKAVYPGKIDINDIKMKYTSVERKYVRE